MFHYPQYLTTPDLRPKYPVELLRCVLFGALLVAGTLSLFNLVRNQRRNLNALALGLVAAAAAWGGAGVPVGNFSKHTPFVGLDWFVVDLLLSGLIFVLIERASPWTRPRRCSAAPGKPTWRTSR